jgi:hypothetical protein
MGLKGCRLWAMGQLDSNVQSPTDEAGAGAGAAGAVVVAALARDWPAAILPISVIRRRFTSHPPPARSLLPPPRVIAVGSPLTPPPARRHIPSARVVTPGCQIGYMGLGFRV